MVSNILGFSTVTSHSTPALLPNRCIFSFGVNTSPSHSMSGIRYLVRIVLSTCFIVSDDADNITVSFRNPPSSVQITSVSVRKDSSERQLPILLYNRKRTSRRGRVRVLVIFRSVRTVLRRIKKFDYSTVQNSGCQKGDTLILPFLGFICSLTTRIKPYELILYYLATILNKLRRDTIFFGPMFENIEKKNVKTRVFLFQVSLLCPNYRCDKAN